MVRRLAEERVAELGAKIELALGAYPYTDYEAMAFWGEGTRFDRDVGAQTAIQTEDSWRRQR